MMTHRQLFPSSRGRRLVSGQLFALFKTRMSTYSSQKFIQAKKLSVSLRRCTIRRDLEICSARDLGADLCAWILAVCMANW